MPKGAQAWGMPKFFDERRVVEELCRENNIRRIDRPTSAIHGYAGTSASMTRGPYVPYPLKNIANLRVDFLKRAAEDRFREDRKMEELSSKEFKIQEIELPTNSLPPLSQQELLVRGDYRGHGDTAPEISRANQENLKHGYYVLSKEEKKILQGNSGNLEFIWDKLKPYNLSNNHTAREAAGLDPMKRNNVLEADRVFVVSEEAVEYIGWKYSIISKPKETIDEYAKIKSKVTALYANFLGAHIVGLVCTSTARTQEEQARIIADKIFQFPDGSNYKTTRSQVETAYKKYRLNEITEENYILFIRKKALENIIQNPLGYRHVSGEYKNVFDIGPNESNMVNYKEQMNQAMIKMRNRGYIESISLYYKETSDESAYHFVIR